MDRPTDNLDLSVPSARIVLAEAFELWIYNYKQKRWTPIPINARFVDYDLADLMQWLAMMEATFCEIRMPARFDGAGEAMRRFQIHAKREREK